MTKYIFNGLAALTMGFAMTACTQDFNYEEQEQQASLNNAQQTLGFYIPDNQDWVMSTTATATFNVKGLSDEATVYVFSNNPYADGYGSVLASALVSSTTTTISEFRIPQHLKKVYVGLKESDGNMVYKYVDVENGQINASYDFSTTPAQARTRSGAVIDGDPFTFEDTSDYYKSSLSDVPNNVRDINTSSDYECVQSGQLLANSDIRSDLNLWSGTVDLYINGNVTLPASAYMTSANIYVLSGSTLTMDTQANNVCRVFVAEGATLNYNRLALETNGGSGHSAIYNRGTVNFPDNFQANNDAIIYNEGNMTGKDITSAPGTNNPSCFYNFGTLELSGKLQLNSCANFFNEGTVTVAGLTECTQGSGQVWWINKGHYTTKQFGIMAWNGTFYNYCQLFIQENASLHDGQFNLMPGGYMETATAEVNNFQINMYGNTGLNIKGDNSWLAQGGSTYQGFKAYGENNYVRLGGTTSVDQHHLTLVAEGKVFIGFNNLYAPNNDNPYDGPYVDLRENTKRVDFSELNPVYNETDCGATWTADPQIETPIVENQTWTYAFEDNKTRCDFDLNDVVIQVRESESNPNKLIVKLVAAGCEYDNYVWLGETPIVWDGGAEVHDAFGATHGVMVNTGNGRGVDMPIVETTIDKPANFVDFQNADFRIRPFRINSNPNDEANATSGYITIVKEGNGEELWGPLGLAIPAKWKWPKERNTINYAYPAFTEWGKSSDLTLRPGLSGWYENPASGLVYGE